MEQTEQTIVLPLPDGWEYKESLTVLAPDGQANVIASSEPLNPTMSTEEYASIQEDLLRTEFPGYTEFTTEDIRMKGGRDAILRRFEWKPPDGAKVTQTQLYYVDGDRAYTATATTPTSELSRYDLVLGETVAGLIIDRKHRQTDMVS